jgi:hypothetical protein
MIWRLKVTPRDALRAAMAGTQGSLVTGAAQTLYEAGGKAMLPTTVQHALRGAVEGEASRMLAGVGLLASGTAATARVMESGAASGVTSGAVRAVATRTAAAAGRQILRGVGVAALGGALVDGGWALAQAIRRVRRGTMNKQQAAIHVATQAGTGAAATAAGAAAAALLVVMTGGVAAPAVFVVGAAASMGAKAGLDAWLRARAKGAIRAQFVAPPAAGPVVAQPAAQPAT